MQNKRKEENYEYRQLSAFAGVDGALVSLFWISSFFCFIAEFEMPLLSFVGLALGLGSLVFAVMRLRKFRDSVRGGILSFGNAMLYSISMFFHASLLMALAQFVYFQFIDHGYLMQQYINVLSMPEYSQAITQVYGMDSKQMIELLQQTFDTMRPIEIAFQFLTVNCILALFISLPVAAIVKRSRMPMF